MNILLATPNKEAHQKLADEVTDLLHDCYTPTQAYRRVAKSLNVSRGTAEKLVDWVCGGKANV